MKVVCDNCRAVYKVPDDKLVKPVNKATCRNCNHRMLIPRPKPNADPEERTLVTAVAPTPPGAPSRTGEPHRPSPDDVPVGTPLLTTRTDNGVEAPADRGASLDAATVRDAQSRPPGAGSLYGLSPPPGSLQTPPTVGRAASGAPSSPPPSAPRKPTGDRPVARPTGEWSAGSRAVPPADQGRRTSGGKSGVFPNPTAFPRSGASAALHDPANDLNWALIGTGLSLFGGFILALMSVYYHPVILWLGLMATFTGGFVTFMVLVTGARGRRPAKVGLSVVLGTMVALSMSTAMVATKWGAEKVIDRIQFSNEGLTAGVSSPTEPPAPVLPAVPAGPASVSVSDPPPSRPAPARSAPAARPEPARATEPEPSPRPAPADPEPAPSSASTARTSTPAPAPAPAPEAARPAATTPQMAAVPMEVIHVMLSNNLDVKRCFVPLLQAGQLPSRVDLKFNILPSGKVTDAHVVQAEYRGTDLDGCLGRAVGGISFPATSGTGNSITYPFVLQ